MSVDDLLTIDLTHVADGDSDSSNGQSDDASSDWDSSTSSSSAESEGPEVSVRCATSMVQCISEP